MTQITKTKSELISTSNDDGQEVEQRLKWRIAKKLETSREKSFGAPLSLGLGRE